MSTRWPKLPLWESLVCDQAKVFVPKPDSCQQSGVLPPLLVHSTELSLMAEPELSRLMLTEAAENAPAASTALAVTVVGPSETLAEFHVMLHGAALAVPTTFPPTRKST